MSCDNGCKDSRSGWGRVVGPIADPGPPVQLRLAVAPVLPVNIGAPAPITTHGVVNDTGVDWVHVDLDNGEGPYTAAVAGSGAWTVNIPAADFNDATALTASAERNGGATPEDEAMATTPIVISGGALSVAISEAPAVVDPAARGNALIRGITNDPLASVEVLINGTVPTSATASVGPTGLWAVSIPFANFAGASTITANAERNGGLVPTDLASDSRAVSIAAPALTVAPTAVVPTPVDPSGGGSVAVSGLTNDSGANVNVRPVAAWVQSGTSLAGATRRGAASNGGTIVAVGGTGTNGLISSTTNGTTWGTRVSGVAQLLTSVAWGAGAGLFVAVGQAGVITTSPDGVTWTPRTNPAPSTLNAVAWTGAQFVAVGNNGVVRTSPDGINWTVQTSGVTTALSAVAGHGSTVVAATTLGNVLVSTDSGVTWTVQATGAATVAGLISTGTLFVTGGPAGFVYTSPDGVTWTSRVLPAPAGSTLGAGSVSAFAWDGTQLVARAGGAAIAGAFTSTDGITWHAEARNPVGTTTGGFTASTIPGYRFVCVTEAGFVQRRSGFVNVPLRPAVPDGFGSWGVSIPASEFEGAAAVEAYADRNGGLVNADVARGSLAVTLV